jgi:hypothetical protein
MYCTDLFQDYPSEWRTGRAPGILQIGLNTSRMTRNPIYNMWATGKLINPVIGLSFNPSHPIMTIGHLDDADHVGKINWVPYNSLDNRFPVDGVAGKNRTLLPFSPPLSGGIYSGSISKLVATMAY